jgi:hypothetical protein
MYVCVRARTELLRELGAHQPFAFQVSGLKPDSRYFVSFEVSLTVVGMRVCAGAYHMCVVCVRVTGY